MRKFLLVFKNVYHLWRQIISINETSDCITYFNVTWVDSTGLK